MKVSPPSRPTIGTVAARAGVATTTVSRVLNGGYVSAELRARVEKVIKDLGYVPSATARGLKYGRKGCIGIAVESVHGPWFMGLLQGVEQELSKQAISVMLASLRVAGKYDAGSVAAWIRESRVDGLIFARYTSKERPLLAAAERAGLPVCFICPDETVAAGFTVRCRNVEAGRRVASLLCELGHEHVGFHGGPRESIDTLDRLRGLESELGRHGVKIARDDVAFAATYQADAGVEAARRYLARPANQRPTALVLGNDALALAFMREVMRAGVSIPGDLSVVGFDGTDEAARFWPGLTTVAQPMQDLGAAACRALIERIEASEPPKALTVEYPMELEARESTGPAPRARARRPGRAVERSARIAKKVTIQ